MTQITDKVFTEAIPADASPYILDSANGKGQGLFWTQPGVRSPPWIDLPPGKWRFLFTTKTATEEDARKVVGGSLLTAEIRLAALMYHKGCMAENYALIEKL